MKLAPALLVLLSLVVPTQAAFIPTNAMPNSFAGPATTLADGRVLFTQEQYVLGKTAAIYDPATQTFFAARGDLGWNQAGQSATRLLDGRVLIAGGGFWPRGSRFAIGGTRVTIFDPATETFGEAGLLNIARAHHAAVLLGDGRVLIAGGEMIEGGGGGATFTPTASAEVFDPATGKSTLIVSMHAKRGTPAAATLPDGRILIVGGAESIDDPAAEIFDPVTMTFAIAPPMNVPRRSTLAVRLQNGDVLIAGGIGYGATSAIASAEVFDVRANRFIAAVAMTSPRRSHNGVAMPNGYILIAGDADTAELYDPYGRTFGSLGVTLFRHTTATTTLLPDGSVLIAGDTPQAERYVPDPPRRRVVR